MGRTTIILLSLGLLFGCGGNGGTDDTPDTVDAAPGADLDTWLEETFDPGEDAVDVGDLPELADLPEPEEVVPDLPEPEDLPVDLPEPEDVQPDVEPSFCGDGVCEDDESWLNCQSDCENPCGDGTCDEAQEDCESCPGDCGACPGEPFCTLSGDAGEEVVCPVLLAAADAVQEKATSLQFTFNFDAAAAPFIRFHDLACAGPDNCMDWDIPPQATIQPSGHSVAWQESAPGTIKVLLTHSSKPTIPITEAWLDGSEVQGDAHVLDIVFELAASVPAGEGLPVTLDNLVAADQAATKLALTVADGILVSDEL
jgi:hypothetical protein